MSESGTFLIVDDDADSRFLNGWALRKAFPGCAVLEAAGAREALGEIVGRAIDGVITDHHLRGESGVEFVGDLRRAGFHCPIVVVTGSADPRVEEAAYRAGASRVISSMRSDLADCLRTAFGPKA